MGKWFKMEMRSTIDHSARFANCIWWDIVTWVFMKPRKTFARVFWLIRNIRKFVVSKWNNFFVSNVAFDNLTLISAMYSMKIIADVKAKFDINISKSITNDSTRPRKKSSKSGKRSVCERWTDKNKEKARKRKRKKNKKLTIKEQFFPLPLSPSSRRLIEFGQTGRVKMKKRKEEGGEERGRD